MLLQLVDAREEPVILGESLGDRSFRREVVERLWLQKLRHEAAGREVPRAPEIESAHSAILASDHALGPPGAAALHRPPTEPAPPPLAVAIAALWGKEDHHHAMAALARASRRFVIDAPDLQKTRDVLASLATTAKGMPFEEALVPLHLGGIVAASARDREMARSIVAAVTSLARAFLG